MHYFSIHTQEGDHLGLKLQSENPPQETAAVRALAACQNTGTPLYWALEKDHVALFDDNAALGRIRGEYLTLAGQTLVLNNLTGTL